MAPAPDRYKDPLFHSRMIRQPGWGGRTCPETKPVSLSYDPLRRGGRGPDLPETKPVSLSYDPLRRGGPGLGLRANGSFPKGAGRLSEKSPARHPPPHRRDGIAWERGRPARILSLWPRLSFSAMLQAATLSAGTASARPKESHGAVPVDPSGGDGRGCARLGAGGTPALPGSRHPMTSSQQGHQIAEAFWRRLSLKQVHLSSGLFVFIRVHSWFVFIKRSAVFPRMIRTAGRGRHQAESVVNLDVQS